MTSLQGRRTGIRAGTGVVAWVVLGCGSVGWGQVPPWDVFQDPLSGGLCDLVNAANAELVVLSDTGELVIVTGADLILEDTFVDLEGTVFFDGFPAGFIDFAVDGDGFRTLWWTSITGRAVVVDGFTGEPSEGTLFPEDFENVPCDACPFWDNPAVCADGGGDGGLPPPISFNFCGVGSSLSLAMTFTGLLFTGLFRRRGG